MKALKKVAFFLVVCFIGGFLTGKTVYASSGTIAFSDPSVTVGETVSVTVKVATTDNSALGGVDLTLAYDSAALEFVSGTSASGDSGTIRIAGVVESSSTTTLSYELKFKALKAGKTGITVSSHDIINLNYENVDITKVGSSAINVTDKASSKLSSDCTLSSLKLSPGTISPAFDKNTLNYTATVANSTTKVAVSAVPTNEKAVVTSVTGTDLEVGKNTVKVIVTAESGADVAYNIEVTRQEASAEKPKEEEMDKAVEEEENGEGDEEGALKAPGGEIDVEIAGADFFICEVPEEVIPEGFASIGYNYGDNVVNALQKDGFILFYLRGVEDEKPRFYLYDEATGGFCIYVPVQSIFDYSVVPAPDDITIPEGFTETEVSVGGIAVKSWQSDNNSEYFLLYLRTSEGDTGLYLYDVVEKTVQRYYSGSGAVLASGENGDGKSEWEVRYTELNDKFNNEIQKRMNIIYGLVVLAALLVFAVINLLLRLSDKRQGIRYDDLDDIDDIDENDDFDDDYFVEEEEAPKSRPKKKPAVKKEKISRKKVYDDDFDDDSDVDDDFDDSDDFKMEIFDFDDDKKK